MLKKSGSRNIGQRNYLDVFKKIEQATETGEINVNYLKILASNTDYPLRNKLKQYLKNIGMKQAELAAITNIKRGI